MHNRLALVSLATLLLASACGSEAAPAAPEPPAAANPPADNSPVAQHGGAAAAPGTHAAMPTAPAAGPAATEGTVQETMDAASYTYMRVETSSGSVWVATMAMPVSVGDHVRFQGSEMQGFHSGTLDRTFDRIIFANSASVIGAEGEAPGNGPAPQGAQPLQPGQTELPAGHPPLGAPAAPAPAPAAPAADPLAH